MTAQVAPPTWLRRHRLQLLASLAIAAAFVWLLHAGALPLVPSRSAFEGIRWWTVVTYLVIWCVVHVIRAARWSYLLAPIARVPLRRVITSAFIGFAAVLVLPLRMGEVVRPVLVRRKGHLSGWAATGTVGAERVLDGLVLALLLFLALQVAEPLKPLPTRIGELDVSVSVVPRAAYALLGVFCTAFVTMSLLYWRRDLACGLTGRVVGPISPRLSDWLAERIVKVADGLRFLPSARHLAPFLFWTVSYWLLNAAAAWLLAWGCGFDAVTFPQACVVVGVVAMGILVPSGPGFFGAFQISVYAALAMFFPERLVVGAGSAYVFIVYLCQFLVTLAAAVASMVLEHTTLRETLAATGEDLGLVADATPRPAHTTE